MPGLAIGKQGAGGHHRVVVIGEGWFFTVSCFLEHRRVRSFLNLHCFTGSQGSGSIQSSQALGFFFPLVRNEVNDMWLIKMLPAILGFYPSSLTLLKEWTAV